VRWDDYTEEIASKQGRIDGRGWYFNWLPWFIHRMDPMPAAGTDDIPPFIESMNQAAAAAMEGFSSAWDAADGHFSERASKIFVDLQHWTTSTNAEKYSGFVRDARKEYAGIRESREAEWKKSSGRCMQVSKDYKSLTNSYRRENERARKEKDPMPPKWAAPEVEMPRALLNYTTLSSAIDRSEDELQAVGLPVDHSA